MIQCVAGFQSFPHNSVHFPIERTALPQSAGPSVAISQHWIGQFG